MPRCLRSPAIAASIRYDQRLERTLRLNSHQNRCRLTVATFFFICTLLLPGRAMPLENDSYFGVYVPAHKITQRAFDEIVHYATLTPINAVVLHVKSPRGRLMWAADNVLAREIGACGTYRHLSRHVARLKADGIRTIAKLDVFADHLLAAAHPEMGILTGHADTPWTDANGLYWTNPGDSRVWDYNIALARELVLMGFEEIQFDYVRFPSDGDLSAIRSTEIESGVSKADCIASFLERARTTLKPLDADISADIFGLTAWKTDDFGVGQVLEKMAPYLDVICPMFYPSHFPAGFLGKQSPGDFPEMIMETSMRSMMKRTTKPIRPWIQGFWYRPQQIVDQIDGIANTSAGSWSIWNPTGRYHRSYEALALRSGVTLTPPQFYPTAETLRTLDHRSVRGNHTLVNFTNFRMGYSIISLEAPQKGEKIRYASPSAVLATLDEGIMDHILRQRTIPIAAGAEPYVKKQLLSKLLCDDLGKDPRRMRPEPIYIDWANDCVFSTVAIPPLRLAHYAAISRGQAGNNDLARMDEELPISMAMVAEPLFSKVEPPVIVPEVSILSQ